VNGNDDRREGETAGQGADAPVAPAKSHAADTGKLVKRIGLVLAGSFVFTFSLVPVYRIACEKVLGIKLQEGPAGQQRVVGMRADESRWVTVEFDGNVNSDLLWDFRPSKLSMKVHPGELYQATYWAKNQSDHAIVGNAAPSITPSEASRYFSKTECFCFTQQTLQSGESKLMPVRFIVDPALPANVNTLTLSYTFYNNDLATAKLGTQAQPLAARAVP
jgi:cytochrome c oxidase assembly protein subunit 11